MDLYYIVNMIDCNNHIFIVDEDNEGVILWEGSAEEYDGQFDDEYSVNFLEAIENNIIIHCLCSKIKTED